MKPLQDADIQALKAHFQGDVLRSDDTGYDEVRQIWNAMIDRRRFFRVIFSTPAQLCQGEQCWSTRLLEA